MTSAYHKKKKNRKAHINNEIKEKQHHQQSGVNSSIVGIIVSAPTGVWRKHQHHR